MNPSNITQGNSYCKYHEPLSDTAGTSKLIAVFLVGGFGVCGNIFVIVLAAKYIVRKNLHHLIINMAVSDTLVVIMNSWFVTQDLLQYSIYGHVSGGFADILCKTLSFLHEIPITVSLVTLLIISIERYRITRKTVRIQRPYSVKQRVAVLTCSWFIPMAMNLQYILFSQVKTFGRLPTCTHSNIKAGSLNLFINTAFIVLSCCALISLSILTFLRLSHPRAIEDSLTEAQRQRRRKRIQSAVRMVLCSLLLYSCCYLPRFIYELLTHIQLSFVDGKSGGIVDFSLCIDWPTLIFMLDFFLPLVNSCLSPCIYFVFLSDFREAARRLLCRVNILQPARTYFVQARHIQNTPM